MFNKSVILRVIILLWTTIILTVGDKNGDSSDHNENEEVNPFNVHLNVSNLGSQFREVIEHFKMADPVGLPGAPIPDPMDTPDIKYKNFPTTILLKNSKIYGLSQFRIEEIQVNLYSLEVELLLSYQKLEVLGNYTASSFLSGKSQGGYNVTIINVSMGGTAKLETTRKGHLEASNIETDLVFNEVKMNFENPTLIINILQGMVNTVGTFVFTQIKPYVLREINTQIKDMTNKVLSSLKNTFPNSISPLDLAIAKGRKAVREIGFDPHTVDDYTYSAGLLSVNVREIYLTGLASFYRVGNMTVYIRRNTLTVEAHISTQLLEGKCNWEATIGSLFSKYGTTSFTVQYVQVRTRFNQSLDLRNKPYLEELDITLGNIQLRMDGMGTFDYLLEFIINILPNVLRREIVTALEGVLKQRIQTILTSLDVEDLVVKNVVSQFETNNNDVSDELIIDDNTFDATDEDVFNLDDLYQEIDD